ncbi:MAG: glycosyltransferase [Methanococcaceae archaeon]
MNKNILFISGSVGLGHVVRDIEIAKELRNQIPGSRITWLASEPACSFLFANGETLHRKINQWAGETEMLENLSKTGTQKENLFNADLIKFFFRSRERLSNNLKLFKEILESESYDLVIGDEIYEINIAIVQKKITIKPTLLMIYDFVGADVMTGNLFEKLIAYRLNYIWVKGAKTIPNKIMTKIFIGISDDVPDRKFGFMLPKRRELVKNIYHFVGYILQFDPDQYKNKKEIRKKLGLDSGPLIICSVGGTSIGLPLLELCCKAFPFVKTKIPEIKMLLVAGPRISADSLDVPDGVIVKEYLPCQYEYFASADLAIVQAGMTTTIELVALQKPFIYFPIEGHFEQQLHVTPRLKRLNAGIEMKYSQTTPESLAEKILSNIGTQVNYPLIPLRGAQNTVNIIKQIFQN